MPKDSNLVQQKLMGTPIENFFLYPMRENLMDEIWDEDPGADLEVILDDTSAPLKARFLACEILFTKDITFQPRHDRKMLAGIYADALQQDIIGFSNPWGLMYKQGDEGVAGNEFLVLRNNAIPALLQLLEDETVRTNYIGSEEATIGNMQRYRVKDFAAWYISRIKDVELEFYQDFKDRDSAILKMLEEAGP